MTNKLTYAAIVEKTIGNLENEVAAHEHNHKLNMQIIADRDARIGDQRYAHHTLGIADRIVNSHPGRTVGRVCSAIRNPNGKNISCRSDGEKTDRRWQ